MSTLKAEKKRELNERRKKKCSLKKINDARY